MTGVDDVVDETEDRPVLVGVIALVGVSLIVGLIVGVVALGGARVFGLNGGGGGGGGGAAVEPTLSLPPVTETPTSSGPLITLTPGDEGEGGEESAPTEPTEPTTTTTEAAEGEITLQVSMTTAGPMERIDVSGIYTGGDGAILTIQRFTDGSWNDIAANAAVSGELFSTYIALGRPGENRIRAIDPSADVTSNEVSVTIG
ncbi:hypothetical protein [Nocardioides zeae]|uniref:Uncharacterized protein n=1 Tax=Nocardioides zeae TaxID=1457234 RepID=A0A6P0HLG6_9ACTN|nr:hypothetical protein [Nocardioides zeae]NEN79097.1 hypothetical protein [Nocardioides zeae]